MTEVNNAAVCNDCNHMLHTTLSLVLQKKKYIKKKKKIEVIIIKSNNRCLHFLKFLFI